jgi:hypothetical protein
MNLIFAFLVLLLVAWLGHKIITMLSLPDDIKSIVLIVFAVVILLCLFSLLLGWPFGQPVFLVR